MDSFFYKTLTIKGFEVHGESLVEFKSVPFSSVPPADWLFFYSKTAVHFFLANAGHTAIAGMKLAALGSATVGELVEEGLHVQFTGDGDPERTATEFLKIAAGCRVLFPHARHSQQSIQRLLGEKIVALDMVVYDNLPKHDFLVPPCLVLVFTSPLNAETYFNKYNWNGEKIVAIGKTTAATLRSLGITKCHIAAKPSEEAMAEMVETILEKRKPS